MNPMNPKYKNIFSAVVVALVIIAIVLIENHKPGLLGDGVAINHLNASKEKLYPKARELVPGGEFFNTENGQPIKLADYVGKKVVLIDFWTYSCINCQRTLPHLKEWYKKYKDNGFVIVGVHSPEFGFEKDPENVKKAIAAAGIEYTVMQDNDMATWRTYGNNYWPREYLIDIDGYIVHDHIGEGQYDETEKAIQQALKERTQVLGDHQNIDMSIGTAEEEIDASSPETYFGAARNEYFGSGQPGRAGDQYFAEQQQTLPNTLYLIGQWNISAEYAETSKTVGNPQTGSDRIDYLYNAKGVYFVAGASSSIEVEVTIDSKPVEQTMKGADVYYRDGRSYIKVQDQRLYRVIDAQSAGKHLIEFIISKPGLQAFAFTFG